MALFDRRNLTLAVVTGVVVAGLTLSGCGRKGPLEPPPNARSTDPAYAVENPADAQKDAKPNRRFILDGLL